jgi:ACS family glucarate transporter-like MFS transporter
MAASATGIRPTRVRHKVVALGVALSFITYIDRVAIAQAAPAISKEMHLTPLQMGYVFSAFGITYALLEIPSGWLCDRIGARNVLTRIVIWWSFFTAATGWAWNLTSLVVTRLLFGAGEAGCFPSLAKIFSIWLPVNERPMAEGIKAAAARLGAAFTPSIIVAMYAFLTWRQTFFIFGLLGVVWALWFYLWYRDRPAEHPSVNAAELELLAGHMEFSEDFRSVPWRKFLGSLSAWALCLQWFCHYFGFYFYITWLPTYLQQSRGLNLAQGAALAGLPMFSAAMGSLFCGWVVPRLARASGSIARTRKWLAYVAYGGASVLLLLFTTIGDPVLAMAVMSLSTFAAELSGPVSWTTSMDLGGRHVGTLSAAMNMTGHFGGSVAPTLIGYILQTTGHNWTLAFYCSAFIYMLGLFCWLVLDPVTPLESE